MTWTNSNMQMKIWITMSICVEPWSLDRALYLVTPMPKAKRILGIAPDSTESPMVSPTMRDQPKRSDEMTVVSDRSKSSLEQPSVLPTVAEHIRTPKVQYVDSGYQPSPPPSPPQSRPESEELSIPRIEEPEAEKAVDPQRPRVETATAAKVASPISPPDTPSVDSETWSEKNRDSVTKPVYNSTSTQTEFKEAARPKSIASNRDSLSPPDFVPSIAIHPPTSRPSSPRPYVLPPGTKNASTQANISSANTRDASMQTEGIRVDKRPVKVPTPSFSTNLLPSPTFEEPPAPKPSRRAMTGGSAIIFQKPSSAPPLPSPPLRSAAREKAAELPRSGSDKELRSMPLRAIPLPRPILAPTSGESEGPLNRSASYGVSQSGKRSSQLLDVDKDTDTSDNEEADDAFEDLAGSIPAFARPPHGRFGLSQPPKVVPEDKEISPERRPDTAGSYGAAPAPSVASSRANSQRKHSKPPAKLGAYRDFRSRSPSFGSIASSAYSSQSAAAPPFPIPSRSSSRVKGNAHSEGSQSPTAHHSDVFGNRGNRGNWPHHNRQGSLRKVQSAAVIRHPARRASPTKSRRRRRHSPDLTPVQSMAIESPVPTSFPIPDLPTPLHDSLQFDYVKGSMDVGRAPTAISSRRASEETNLVDAIAGTMVGEWMWKYVRKRKSFGVQEDFPIAEDGSVNTSQHGTRHKRWVWLSPYERTIMWDNKQPTSGTALLGKKGRKRMCTYRVVLRQLLTIYSGNSVCLGRRRSDPSTQGPRADDGLQTIHPYPNTSASAQIHHCLAGKAHIVDDCTLLPCTVRPSPVSNTLGTTDPEATSSTNACPTHRGRWKEGSLPIIRTRYSPRFHSHRQRQATRLPQSRLASRQPSRDQRSTSSPRNERGTEPKRRLPSHTTALQRH